MITLWGVLGVIALSLLVVAWTSRRSVILTVARRFPASRQMGRVIWPTVKAESPVLTSARAVGPVLHRALRSTPAIPSRFADATRHRGATPVPSDGEFERSDTDLSVHALSDNIIGSLCGAGLSLDRLADRLSDPQDKGTLDTAVQHLDDVVRNVRLMLHAIDRTTLSDG